MPTGKIIIILLMNQRNNNNDDDDEFFNLSQLWAQNFEPIFFFSIFFSSLGSQIIPVFRARSCMNGKLGKPLSQRTE